MTPKIIIHRLNCPAIRQRDAAEHGRRRRWQAMLAVFAGAVVTAGAFHHPDTVEDYSLHHSHKSMHDEMPAPASTRGTASLLADSGTSR